MITHPTPRTLITILVTVVATTSFAADAARTEYTLRDSHVHYRREKPPKNGPAERLIEVFELVKQRKFEEAKTKYFSQKMSAEDREWWSVFNLGFKKQYDLGDIYAWGVLREDKNGNPIVTVSYRMQAGNQGLLTQSMIMVKEDGTWKVKTGR